MFTDGNAATSFTEFSADPHQLDTYVDWPLMRATQWANTTEDPDRRRRRMAEFLVHEAVPLEIVGEIGVYNARMRDAVAAIVGPSLPVRVRRDWYF